MIDALFVCVNASLFLVLMLRLIRQYRTINLAVLLSVIYCVISVAAVVYYLYEPEIWDLSLWSFIFLFVVSCLFFRPLCRKRFNILNAPIDRNKGFYAVLSFVFIAVSILCCALYLPKVVESIQNGDWLALYEEAHEEDRSFSPIFTIAHFSIHLRNVGWILTLLYYIKFRKVNLFVLLLALCSILPSLLAAIATASRGGFAQMLYYLIAGIIVFKEKLPKQFFKTIKWIIVALLPIVVAYFTAVTISRFAVEAMDADESVLSYLGQPMLVFNYGVVDTIHNFAVGGFMFNSGEISRISGRSMDAYFGTHYGVSFFTFVGGLYLDFGPIGTIIIALVFPYIIKCFISKKSIDIPDTYLIVSYVTFLMNGVFVVGRGYGSQLIEMFVVFFMLKVFQKIRVKKYVFESKNNCILSSAISSNVQ